MTHVPRWSGSRAARCARSLQARFNCRLRPSIALLLAILFGLTPISFSISAQQSGSSDSSANTEGGKLREVPANEGNAYIIYIDENGEVSCRDATATELRELNENNLQRGFRPINHPELDLTNLPSLQKMSSDDAEASDSPTSATGLTIILNGSTQLDSFPDAKAAFVRAAANWEAIISSPITIVMNVDFGPNQPSGQAWGTNTLGSTSGGSLASTSFTNLRNRLINNSASQEESNLYNALPQSVVPTDSGDVSSVVMSTPIARALGFLGADQTTAPFGQNPITIGFNSAFNYDFNPTDGITSNFTDFDAVATHEIGHALGFTSRSGYVDAGISQNPSMSVWDLFRFQPGVASLANFSTAPRILHADATGGGLGQVSFNGGAAVSGATDTTGLTELGLSTGGPNGDLGDSHQSSHWREDSNVVASYIGIMDPTISRNRRLIITANDIRTLNYIGYQVGGSANPLPPPTPPANDAFANAVTISGVSGSISGTNLNGTKEGGEPSHSPDGNAGGSSVWYRWTAPGNGSVTFTTAGSNYDTLLAAYTGSSVSGLSPLAKNDDVPTNTTSTITFNATGGTVYSIAVDGYGGDAGNITLNWTSNIVAPAPTYSISGRVTDSSGNGASGVTVSLSGSQSATTQTNSSGNYSFSSLTSGGSYTVTPSNGANYTFSPLSQNVNNLGSNQTVNFIMAAFFTPQGRVTDSSGNGLSGVSVGMTMSNGTSLGQVLTDQNGNYAFQTRPSASVTLSPFKMGYSFTPANVALQNPVGTQSVNFVGAQGNPIDDPSFFVTQTYQDFLGRNPDAGGLAFWAGEINSCLNLTDATARNACIDDKRSNVSAAFFLSPEFQGTGYFVYLSYIASLPETATRPRQFPRFTEFMADKAIVANGVVAGVGAWEAQLEANKQAYLQALTQRAEFLALYPAGMSANAYATKLFQTAGLTPTPEQLQAVMNAYGSGNTAGRAAALRLVVDNQSLRDREFRRAFVLLQYIGYMRRSPDEAPNLGDFGGYDYWLTKLNTFNGNYIQSEMVRSFIVSPEYRQRFGTQ